ncbi:hypothetical protein [Candidatus Laterigemmans baculatus]|uniref:hypothetical protein n=1 Tax=Candidatus Laterigemmans baculatus TaxID=2770505 RepID=UPI0013D9C269|nr:hypothetical protein [Candidatus Laterigemmans baculatus]
MTAVSNETKKETSERLIGIFFLGCKIGFPLIGVAVLVALLTPFFVSELDGKVLTAKLTFTALGLLFGILQVFLGVLLALVGVTIDYDVDAGVGPAKIKLASASPGILLLLVGNLLFAFSLMREFEFTKTTKEHVPFHSPTPDVQGNATNEDDPLRGSGGPE